MNPDRKKILKEIGSRMEEVRKTLKHSHERMASHFGLQRSTYTKYELGETFPGPNALEVLGSTFDVSLDWLICNKGPMFYKEKASWEEKTGLETVMSDVKELLDHMERIPLLRYEVLSFFHRFMRDNKEKSES